MSHLLHDAEQDNRCVERAFKRKHSYPPWCEQERYQLPAPLPLLGFGRAAWIRIEDDKENTAGNGSSQIFGASTLSYLSETLIYHIATSVIAISALFIHKLQQPTRFTARSQRPRPHLLQKTCEMVAQLSHFQVIQPFSTRCPGRRICTPAGAASLQPDRGFLHPTLSLVLEYSVSLDFSRCDLSQPGMPSFLGETRHSPLPPLSSDAADPPTAGVHLTKVAAGETSLLRVSWDGRLVASVKADLGYSHAELLHNPRRFW